MRLPTPIFSKFTTVSVVVIYGIKVNSKCLYNPYMANSKVPHLLKVQFRRRFVSLIFNLICTFRRGQACIADLYFKTRVSKLFTEVF